jgi:DivIVA domain-containing protein
VPDRNKVVRSFQIVMRGYDRRQVDELLARIDGTLGRGPAVRTPVTAADVRAARFAKTMRGYAPREVDEALNAAAAELDRRSA